MTTKILSVGDLHSKLTNQEELRKCASSVCVQIEAQMPNAIVIHGDTLDGHEKSHVLSFNGVVHYLGVISETAAKIGRKVYYLVGNHDFLNNQQFLSENHYFNAFKRWPNVIIVDKPTRLKAADGYVLLCPYVPPGRFEEAIKPIMPENPKDVLAVFCHQEFFGAKLGALPSKNGDKWPEDAPLVISGHIHNYDRLQKNILYIGAPMYHSFVDEGPKTISLFTFEENGEWSEERTDLGMLRKITMTLDVEHAKTFDPPEGAQIRLNLVGTFEEIVAFKSTDQFKRLNQQVKIVPKIADKISLEKNVERKSYIEIVHSQCDKEDALVKEALVEICNETDSK